MTVSNTQPDGGRVLPLRFENLGAIGIAEEHESARERQGEVISRLMFYVAMGVSVGLFLVFLALAWTHAPTPERLETRDDTPTVRGCRIHVDCVEVSLLV